MTTIIGPDKNNDILLLKKSEEKFRTIFQNASEGIFISDNQGNYTDVNDVGLKMLGYTREELFRLNLKDLIPLEQIESTYKTFSKIREGKVVSGEHHIICKDGKLLPVEISASILPDGSLLGMVRDISERKEAEIEKDYLLSFNKRLIENSPIGTLLYKVSSGQCVLANNAAKTAIGASIEKLLDQNFWEIPSWKDSELLENAIQVTETGERRKFTAHFTTSFGRNVWLDCQMASLFMEGEKHLLLTIIDITERSKAEEALKKSEEKFYSLFENAGSPILLIDDTFQFVDCNQAAVKILGAESKEKLIPIHPSDVSPKYQPDGQLSSIKAEQMIKNGYKHGSTKFEWVHNKIDGTPIFMDITLSVIPFENKNMLMVHWNDITARKLSEEALKESEERFKSIIELAADGILLGSPKGMIIGANQQICIITGYTEQELLNTNISFLFSEEQLKSSPLRYDLLDLGKIVRNERIITRKDGSLVPIEMNTKKMPDNTYQTIIRDITERLISEALNQKVEKSEYQNNVKSQFMANLSHEIRNPLSAILGFNSLMAKTDLSPEQEKFNKAIGISSENLLNILNDILDFSKIEANKITLNFSDFNLRDLVEELITLYELKAKEKNIVLNHTISANVPEFLTTDKNKIKQIITNLLGNAIKFTEQGKIDLLIDVKHKENKTLTLEFHLKDTGIGIERNDLDKAFQSFTQLDSSTKKIYSGTGLGLSICKSYVELLGGNISVTSDVGIGSEFSFSIPLIIAKQPESKEIENTITAKLPSQLSDKQFEILVVEDEAINRLYLTRLLKSQNFKVDSASNGYEAIELFRKNKFDLIIMDCQMPKMDGFEATQRIREFERENKLRQTTIIAFSGYSLNDVSEKFEKAEMNDYMIKPINESELFNKIMTFSEINKKINTKRN